MTAAARIIVGDVRDVLATLDAGSVQTCVTSPPYFQLRDYNVPGQIGLEPTIGEYIATMVDVFRGVRRVLRDDGTVWCNVADSYAPDKNLRLMPERLAIALQADGWIVRADILWTKRNPMPESVQDRPTVAHEHIWLLTKQASYFYDPEPIRTPAKDPDSRAKNCFRNGDVYVNQTVAPSNSERRDKQRGHSRRHDGFNDRWDGMTKDEQQAMGANARTVWDIATSGYREAHFATFPLEIPRRCILAGTSERGACPACGAPWKRTVDAEPDTRTPYKTTGTGDKSVQAGRNDGVGLHKVLREDGRGGDLATIRRITTGWQPTCRCDAGEPRPCVVLDPFSGAGTTGVVALRHGRDYIGIELNSDYAAMSERRIRGDAPLLNRVELSAA